MGGCGITWLKERFLPFVDRLLLWQQAVWLVGGSAFALTTFILKKLKILSHPFVIF